MPLTFTSLLFIALPVMAILILYFAILFYKAKQQSTVSQQKYIQQLTEITALETELNLLKSEKEQKGELIHRYKLELDDEKNAHQDSRRSIERLETLIETEKKHANEKLQLLNNAQDTLKHEFNNLANHILEEKSLKFTEQNKSNIDSIMKPLREQLSDFKKRVEDTYDKESKDRVSLFEQVKQLQVLNTQLSDDAHKLTSALKGSAKTQGNWGELVLERILEQSGLEKGREYETQALYTNRDVDGQHKRYQPDVIIHMPENKSIIVDAKVSLNAYERYCSTETDQNQTNREQASQNQSEKKSLALKEHLSAVKSHVDKLSAKNYQDLDDINTLDFVVLFMPIEAAFLLAMQSDQALYQYAMDKNIFIVSPSNLLVMLRVINHTWRNEKQNQNAQIIAENAGKLYDKFVGFVTDMDDIGKKLNQTQQSWEKGINKLQNGNGNIIKRTEDLKKLGAKANKSLPEAMLSRSDLLNQNSDS